MASGGGEAVLFKSVVTDEYVRPIDEYAPLRGHLSADGKGDPKMYLEKARAGSDLYHIKSRATGNYWQVKSAEPSSNSWITADARATNEDPQSLACTMFRMESFGSAPSTTIRFRHRHLNRYVRLYKANETYPNRLCAYSVDTDRDSKDVFVYSKSQ